MSSATINLSRNYTSKFSRYLLYCLLNRGDFHLAVINGNSYNQSVAPFRLTIIVWAPADCRRVIHSAET